MLVRMVGCEMTSDVKEKLVKLLDSFNSDLSEYAGNPKFFVVDDNIKLADYLIANGVTVQQLTLPEQDYYVLRNMETGMYFRGKGVNRWGKHFNQATIYRVKGTAEHSIKEIAWHGEKAELVRIKLVEMP